MVESRKKRVLVVGHSVYGNPFLNIADITCIEHPYVTPVDVEWADVVLFTGGEDVSPELYEEPAHPFTQSNWHRDMMEREIFTWAVDLNKKMAGICRGSQFLNVMMGGKMEQHVNGHGIRGTHPIYDAETGKEIANVTSTHHQISRLPKGSRLLARGHIGKLGVEEVEAYYNKKYRVLGVQFHPEYMATTSSGWQYYQKLIKEYILC